jgi:hypothetical protein
LEVGVDRELRCSSGTQALRDLLFLLPSGEGGAQRRMRVRRPAAFPLRRTLSPDPSPDGRGEQSGGRCRPIPQGQERRDLRRSHKNKSVAAAAAPTRARASRLAPLLQRQGHRG